MAREVTRRWGRIKSWHIVYGYSRAGLGLTPCGRSVRHPAAIRDGYPADEKTCESCLRWLERQPV